MALAASTVETFRFTLSRVAQESELVAWFQQAEAGDTVTYAEGFVEPREAAGWKLAGAWAREGLVHLTRDAAPENRQWKLWIMQRSSAGPRAPKAPRDRSDDVTRLQLGKLLDTLRACADRAEPLPPRQKLALALTGFGDRKARNRTTYLLERLAEQGKIELIRAPLGASHGPQVTILAKGRGQGKTTPVGVLAKGVR
jgi:hypothetical protein